VKKDPVKEKSATERAQDKALRRLYALGYSPSHIADSLGMSRSRVLLALDLCEDDLLPNVIKFGKKVG
jgi:DNA-binding transcriptional regulator LsrR (DeoR family)